MPPRRFWPARRQGIGTEEVLEAIVKSVPPPSGDAAKPLRALIFDSHFDQYLGVVAYLRVVDGEIKPGMRIRMMASGKEFEVSGCRCVQARDVEPTSSLGAGEVGYFTAGMKNVGDTRVGDTVTDAVAAGYRASAGLSRCEADGVLRPVPDRFRAVYRLCATLWSSFSSMTPRLLTSPKAPRPWGSAFDADSSGCCTWTSCRSGWSASSI